MGKESPRLVESIEEPVFLPELEAESFSVGSVQKLIGLCHISVKMKDLLFIFVHRVRLILFTVNRKQNCFPLQFCPFYNSRVFQIAIFKVQNFIYMIYVFSIVYQALLSRILTINLDP